MNAENFGQYLKNPSQLYQLSYQELKSLVLQYPYCSNLHVLLAQKSKIDQHKDWENNLNKAAIYSVDRSNLHSKLQEQALKEIPTDHFSLEEDFLELKDLSVLEEVLEKIPLEQNEEEPLSVSEEIPITKASEGELDPSPIEVPEDLVPLEKEELSLDGSIEVIKSKTFQNLEVIQDIIAIDQVLDLQLFNRPTRAVSDTPTEKGPKPIPKSSFSSWIQQFQPNQVNIQLGKLMESKKREDLKKERKKKKKKKKKNSMVSLIAQQSIETRREIISETLANLLAEQGFYEKAINMYERLILTFPEKSGFFAEKIENLKNNS